MDSADRALGGATPVTMAAAVASSPEVSLHGPKYRGVRKYLGGAPNADRTALIGVPAHDRCVLKLDLETGEVNHLEAKTPKGPFKWLRGVLGTSNDARPPPSPSLSVPHPRDKRAPPCLSALAPLSRCTVAIEAQLRT